MATKTEYVIFSGEGTGEGTRRVVVATDRGIKRILTRERCGGDRWAKAYYRLNRWQDTGINSEDGEARPFVFV